MTAVHREQENVGLSRKVVTTFVFVSDVGDIVGAAMVQLSGSVDSHIAECRVICGCTRSRAGRWAEQYERGKALTSIESTVVGTRSERPERIGLSDANDLNVHLRVCKKYGARP